MSRNFIYYCHNCMQQTGSGSAVCPYCGHDNSCRDNPAHTLRDGTILNGKYIVGHILGSGGFGITYLGFDLNLEMKVAIKEYFPVGAGIRSTDSNHVTPSTALSDPNGFEQGCRAFQSEAITLASVNSPNIVQVREYFRENGTAYIVMEYIEGNSLTQELKNCGGKIPWQRVLSLFKPLIRELYTLHAKHLIHRDIKPDNIKISANGKAEHLVLLDFGTARSFVSAEITHTYDTMVTPGYAPYEQYSRKSRQGPYTDVYAICATMYKLITGTALPDAIDRKIHDELLPPRNFVPDLPEHVEKAILHGLQLMSEDRTQTMMELYEELEDPGSRPTVNSREDLYNRAIKRMQEGSEKSLEEAEELFEQADGWMDADRLLQVCRQRKNALRQQRIYENAEQELFSGTRSGYKTALSLYSQIRGYKDADQMIELCHEKLRWSVPKSWRILTAVLLAIAVPLYFLLRSGRNQKPAAVSTPIPAAANPTVLSVTSTIRPTATKTPKPTVAKTQKPTATNTTWQTFTTGALKAGDKLTFGHYEQDNDPDNGPEAIEWQVLTVQDNRALLISRYGLDAMPFNTQKKEVTWQTSSLRKWLDSDFYTNAFSNSEKEQIVFYTNSNPDNSKYDTRGGSRTSDRIFLLNIDEAEQYFINDNERKCQATAYARAKGVYVSGSTGSSFWWLRTMGYDNTSAAGVFSSGSIYTIGYNVDNKNNLVRPAFWLDLSEPDAEMIEAEPIMVPTDTPAPSNTPIPTNSPVPTNTMVLAAISRPINLVRTPTKSPAQTKMLSAEEYYKKSKDLYNYEDGYNNESFEMLMQAALQDHAEAQQQIADLYFYGGDYSGYKNIKQNKTEALKWYIKSAENIDNDDIYGYRTKLGDLYYLEEFGSGKETEAAKWYRTAAEKGSNNGMIKLGNCYEFGIGVEKNISEAEKWYKKAEIVYYSAYNNYYQLWTAAKNGNSDAQTELAYTFAATYGVGVYGSRGIPSVFEYLRWLTASAEAGNSLGQLTLAKYYYYGAGDLKNQPDYSTAIYWLRKAADQGESEAYYMLGTCYENGLGVTKNQSEANYWYDLAEN